MKHHAINPDEAIDRVLHGLREAEPLEGMQQRVLHAAKERASARRSWSLRMPLRATHFWAIAAATITVIALTASWKIATVARTYRIVHETAHAVPAHLTQTNGPEAEAHLAAPYIIPPRPPHEARRASTADHAEPAEPISGEDALAISEMLAPSKPAPPLSLTHQERLLAEVVHRGAPEELASLRPDMRVREIEIAKTEFRDFFEPPPAKENE